ncbi:MAG: capsular polysaccharide biosynthesis protein [Pseudomonadota bacterium]
MAKRADIDTATTPAPEQVRVFAFSLSFFTNKHLRRGLAALGVKPRFGLPGKGDWVLVWGRKPVAKRGQAIARWRGARVLTLEDGFLRSVRTGREGEPGFSYVMDDLGIYFDTSAPSRLQQLMDQVAAEGPTSDAAKALSRWRASGLSKYNAGARTPLGGLPDSYVLVIDQTRGDASLIGAGASAETFETMLATAKAENPGKTILLKSHPEVSAGQRPGHFSPGDEDDAVVFWDKGGPLGDFFAQAEAVYCVSSLMGLEAVLHGLRPIVFGDAFYCGRGLTDDRHARTPAKPALSVEGLFDATYRRYVRYVDRALGEEVGFDFALNALRDVTRAHRLTGRPLIMAGMRLWKRGFLRRMFASVARFDDAPVTPDTDVAVWAGKATPELVRSCSKAHKVLYRMEDGFLRSRGLGAELVVPASLALDDQGIYYDPSHPSRMEQLIAASVDLAAADLARAHALRQSVVEAGVSKYNLVGEGADFGNAPGQQIILVPGQVEDDQSILKGTAEVRTNAGLLGATRAAFPDAWIVYKPHPDVVAGLRDGGQPGSDAANQVLENESITDLLSRVDRVATMTSLTGFEALLRGIPVTVFGQPFYAGWGLTDDRAPKISRRGEPVTLDGLTHAALIDYPLYWDPVTGLPCGPESVVKRLSVVTPDRRSRRLRLLAKAQGLAASYAHLWR